ncbi:hypothetical protein ACR6EC_19790 [Bacillus subtilis]|uniref:hypothetical protein n=1 Tax=Bacillus subtilis group TaxID=653685 RepID=UPI0007E92B38|nr:hypothetical protein [Bacillus subtilis]OAZ70915.1 hypothetical protein SRCM101280_00741 [Bacillus subtilis]
MNKKPVKSVRAGSVKEVYERMQEAYNLGFMIEVTQLAEVGAFLNPNLFMIDLYLPMKEGAE